VLSVVVKPCRLPTLSDHFRRCELFGVPEEAAQLRFREFIAKRGVPETAAFPGKAAAVSNITVRSRNDPRRARSWNHDRNDHPDTATSLNNLASLLQAQGDFAATQLLFERALAIREKALGPDHLDTRGVRRNLVTLLERNR
jgi:hypothetical protein